MSRTKRYPRNTGWGENTIEDVKIEVVSSYLWRSTKTVRRRKKKEVYEAEFKKASAAFDAEWAYLMKADTMDGLETRDYWREHNDAPHWLRYKHTVYRWIVTEEEKVLEDEIAEALAKFAKRSRDGYYSDNRSKGFRRDCARSLRNKNKKLCRDIVRDVEYDQKPYPSRKAEKWRVWDWW